MAEANKKKIFFPLLYGFLLVFVVAAGFFLSNAPRQLSETADLTKSDDSPKGPSLSEESAHPQLTPSPSTSEASSLPKLDTLLRLEVRAWQLFKELQGKRFSFAVFQDLPIILFPRDVDSGVLPSVQTLHFSSKKRSLTLAGKIHDDHTLEALVQHLKISFPETIVKEKRGGERFEILLAFPSSEQHEILPPPSSLSEIEKLTLEKAIPVDRDSDLFSISLPQLLAKNRLMLREIQFHNTQEVSSSVYRFPFSLVAEGFLTDFFLFLQESEKLSRFLTIDTFEIEIAEVRSAMAIGKAKIQFSVYYRS